MRVKFVAIGRPGPAMPVYDEGIFNEYFTMTIRCLIIDRDSTFCHRLGQFIASFGHDFEVHVTSDSDEAIEAIASIDISLIFCELSLVLSTGLVSCIMDKRPAIPLIIIGHNDSSRHAGQGVPGFVKGCIPRHVRSVDLAGKVVLALDRLFYQGNVSGVNCSTFIQLLEQNCRDCTLRVIHSQDHIEGLLFFKKGVIIDAVCDTSEALDAVERILSWQNTEIELYNICPLRKNRINTTAAILILRGSTTQESNQCQNPATEMKTLQKRIGKSTTGLAGLFFEKAKGKQ